MTPRRLHRLVVRAYPPGWRARYGSELLALLGERGSGWRDVPDLLAGAVDAWLNLRVRPGEAAEHAISSGLLAATGSSAGTSISLPPVSPRTHGIVASGPRPGELSRRTFMRRVLAIGTALLTFEFAAGTINFLWPQIRTGLGAKFRVGTVNDVLAIDPRFANGWPYSYGPARTFLVNVPAAKELAMGRDVSITNLAATDLLALWRKCPHLGCLVPAPCESITRYQCRCHRSTYNILGEKMHEGPAERGLDRFAVSIESDGTIVIDTSRLTQGPPNLGQGSLSFHDPHPWEATCSEA
jgi:nitrite reductase/ring-hydroxylating ferredoxin subunit